MKIVDLTHPISGSLRTYFPWHPETVLERTASYDAHRCLVTRISIGTHTGTHIDAPSHVIEGGKTLDQYDPSLWVRKAVVIDVTPRNEKQIITRKELEERNIERGIGVIVRTGWDVHFGANEYYETYPPISNEAAEYLVGLNVPVLAADTPFRLDVHYTCLRQGIPLITNLNNTSSLPAGIVTLVAAPLLIKEGDGAPARVFALID